MKGKRIGLCLQALFLFSGCMTMKSVDMASLSYMMLLQHGQNAAAAGRYKKARIFYEEAINRYGENAECYVETQYEIAHSFMKEHKYRESFDAFQDVLGVYDSMNDASLPMAYKKLSLLSLDKIPEKYKR